MAGFAHLATGMAAKWVAPEANVVGLVVAAEALDLVYFPPISLVVEVPIWVTHGLFMSLVWSGLVTVVLRLLRKTWRVSIVYGLVVFSHWILDFITHPMGAVTGSPLPPDLPLALPGSPLVGLGLYNHSVPLAVAFEIGVTLLGVGAYVLLKRRERNAGVPLLTEV